MSSRKIVILVALAATLALLLVHAGLYAFLTDDAYISFRYARNLADGHGLVFNPGGDRVEGYTNFLWVVVLAAVDRLGIAPERAANVLSVASTVALWALVAAWALGRPCGSGSRWTFVVPLVWLAATRSVAVWSTGGLETRLFEALVLGGVLRAVEETRRSLAGEPPGRPLAGVVLGLAALVRPEGILLGALALGATRIVRRRRHVDLRHDALTAAGFAVPVLAHFAFRVSYYDAWLPNTFHAKVGGRAWWEMGAAYLGVFALEYFVWLWLPLLVAAVVRHRRERTLWIPGVFAAVLAPYLVYVASVGGDHFEFRPLGLVFPLAYLAMHDGLREVVSRAGRTVAVLMAAAVLAGVVWIPFRSHLDFPTRYVGGFPGFADDPALVSGYLDPARVPPGLRVLARWHRDLLLRTTSRFVGIRQEEHAMFLEDARSQGLLLRGYIDRGWIPGDLRVALSCVGAVPYYTDLPTVDRLGLTDATVARAESVSTDRFLAHEKRDIGAYLRQAGVELGAFRAARLVVPADEPDLLADVGATLLRGASLYAGRIEPGRILVGSAPNGIDALARRLPAIDLVPLQDAEGFAWFRVAVATALERRLERDPADRRAKLGLAQALFLGGEHARAETLFREVLSASPGLVPAATGLAGVLASTGRGGEARALLEDAARRADDEDAAELRRILDRIPSAR